MKDKTELRAMSLEALQGEILALRKSQFNCRLKKASGTLEKPHLVKKIRRSIARIKTIMTEIAGRAS